LSKTDLLQTNFYYSFFIIIIAQIFQIFKKKRTWKIEKTILKQFNQH